MTEKKIELLHALRDTLRYHQAIGIDEYPANQDVRQFLETEVHPGKRTGKQGGQNGTTSFPSAGIENLGQEILACSLCNLSRETPVRVPGQGRTDCRLMVVGDWSAQTEIFSADTLFGREEDVMLWKMMTAIGLQPDQVYVTNCLKCCPHDQALIDETCTASCFSYLAREIAAVQPKIICAMGEMAGRSLTGRKEPLARIRGRFSSYRDQSDRSIMVMATFHPRFLQQHQELKKATWNDLQAVKKILDEQP